MLTGMARPSGRRDEILAAFIRSVAERGYERTNFGDIAAELGMSKGTIVHHFGTKDQLLRELQAGASCVGCPTHSDKQPGTFQTRLLDPLRFLPLPDTSSMPTRLTIATPFHWLWPTDATS